MKCSNTCWEAGKVARDRLKKKIATFQEGVTLRKQEIEQAKLAIAKDEVELSKLKNEEKVLKGLVEQLKGMLSILDTNQKCPQLFVIQFPMLNWFAEFCSLQLCR